MFSTIQLGTLLGKTPTEDAFLRNWVLLGLQTGGGQHRINDAI